MSLWINKAEDQQRLLMVDSSITKMAAKNVVMIEMGVSDGYGHLKADIMVWLHEFHCRSAILLWLNERPRFSFPSQESDSAYSPTQSAMFATAMAQNRRNTPFGSYLFNGHNWFGTLNTAFIEVYQRDLATDSILPVQKYKILEDGNFIVQGDMSIKNEFTPIYINNTFHNEKDNDVRKSEP